MEVDDSPRRDKGYRVNKGWCLVCSFEKHTKEFVKELTDIGVKPGSKRESRRVRWRGRQGSAQEGSCK